MPVNAKLEPGLGGDVDEPKAVLLACFKDKLVLLAPIDAIWIGHCRIVRCAISRVQAIDQSGERARKRDVESGDSGPDVKFRLVAPVCQKDAPEILVIVSSCRAVDN